jgi:hypothetical protein
MTILPENRKEEWRDGVVVVFKATSGVLVAMEPLDCGNGCLKLHIGQNHVRLPTHTHVRMHTSRSKTASLGNNGEFYQYLYSSCGTVIYF